MHSFIHSCVLSFGQSVSQSVMIFIWLIVENLPLGSKSVDLHFFSNSDPKDPDANLHFTARKVGWIVKNENNKFCINLKVTKIVWIKIQRNRFYQRFIYIKNEFLGSNPCAVLMVPKYYWFQRIFVEILLLTQSKFNYQWFYLITDLGLLLELFPSPLLSQP